ncbi:hypothetical protein [Lactiplantibacillus fabifermentans]|nr:hypothetical protein [Lactiplantibacillus fabifermentans]ETY72734.1 hypothetical protein LFAB_16035 [Lactiplantibacillus fabifermentans T30PCM01]
MKHETTIIQTTADGGLGIQISDEILAAVGLAAGSPVTITLADDQQALILKPGGERSDQDPEFLAAMDRSMTKYAKTLELLKESDE